MSEAATSSSGSLAVEPARAGGVSKPPPEPEEAQREAVAQTVRQARDAGTALSGPGGLVRALTAQVLEAALGEELNEHLGHDEHDPVGRGSGSSRNTTRSRSVVTDDVGTIRSRCCGRAMARSSRSRSRDADAACQARTRRSCRCSREG